MSESRKIWDSLKRPPATALKAIGAGRLKGKTDINPQWRYEAMTEQFGPIGFGWTYEIVKQWLENGHAEQVAAFTEIKLKVRVGGEWSEPIPGVGGSMLVVKESAGLHTSDEAYKMSLTDALSVAMKQLGVAADIYAGLWDGSKYRDPVPQQKEPQSKAPANNPPPDSGLVERANKYIASIEQTPDRSALDMIWASGESLRADLKAAKNADLFNKIRDAATKQGNEFLKSEDVPH